MPDFLLPIDGLQLHIYDLKVKNKDAFEHF